MKKLLSLSLALLVFSAHAFNPMGGFSEMGGTDGQFLASAPLTEGLQLNGGIGSITHPANDSADGQRPVRDHEGIYRAVKQNEARFDGARRVEN